jgi:putative CocE/NonD family hydrolase
LHSGGRANGAGGDGLLSWEKPRDETPDRYLYDPLNPVPTVGGNHSCDYARILAGPIDQREVEKRQDVLVYSSKVLDKPVEIAGPIKVELHVASTARDTDFTAKLVDVQPDGRAINLSEGIVRASVRNSIYERRPIQPGKVYEYTIHLVDLSHLFLPGHCIRLEISSSNFPKYSRNLNTGADNHTTEETIVAEQTIFHDTRRPSALVVWVR